MTATRKTAAQHAKQPAGLCAAAMRILPWVSLALAYLMDLWFQFTHEMEMLQSDVACEMILSDLLRKSGEILSADWIYSTELRVFYLQWFHRVGLLFFPQNWRLAHLAANALLLAVYAAAAYFFGRALGLRRGAVWLSAMLLLPFGQLYLTYGIYSGDYFIYNTFSLLIFGLILRCARAGGRAWYCYGAVAGVLSFMVGLNGIKTMLILHVPLVLAVLLVMLLALHGSGAVSWRAAFAAMPERLRLLGATGFAAACAFAGYLVNTKVFAKMYWYHSFDSMRWGRAENEIPLSTIFLDFFHDFGYEDGLNVLKPGGIGSAVGLLLGGLVFAAILWLLLRLKQLSPARQCAAVFLPVALLLDTVLYGYLNYYEEYFWVAAIPFGMAALALAIAEMHWQLPRAKELAAVAVALCFAFCGICTLRMDLQLHLRDNRGLDAVAQTLQDEGCTQGYATFWTGPALTYLTNGEIEVWTLENENSDAMMEWYQRVDHKTREPEHPFLLLDYLDGDPADSPLVQGADAELIYDDGRYAVYRFDSAADFHANFEKSKK